MSFGSRIKLARLQSGLTQREVAERLRNREDTPISATYLHDMEHDRRAAPPSYLIDQIATVLSIPREVLFWEAGRLPPDYCGLTEDHDLIIRAYAALREQLRVSLPGARGEEP